MIREMHYGFEPKTSGTYLTAVQCWSPGTHKYCTPHFEVMNFINGKWIGHGEFKVLAWAMLPDVKDVLKEMQD